MVRTTNSEKSFSIVSRMLVTVALKLADGGLVGSASRMMTAFGARTRALTCIWGGRRTGFEWGRIRGVKSAASIFDSILLMVRTTWLGSVTPVMMGDTILSVRGGRGTGLL